MKHFTILLRFKAPLQLASPEELMLFPGAILLRLLRIQASALPTLHVARLKCPPFHLLKPQATLILRFMGMALVTSHVITK